MLTLITADNCVDCKVLKHNLPNGHGIRIIDADTPEGMAELAYHEVTAIPCLIVGDEAVIGVDEILERIENDNSED